MKNDLNSMAWHLRKTALSVRAVSVCAWCDADKSVTRYYKTLGIKVSHSICVKHRDEMLRSIGYELQLPAKVIFGVSGVGDARTNK